MKRLERGRGIFSLMLSWSQRLPLFSLLVAAIIIVHCNSFYLLSSNCRRLARVDTFLPVNDLPQYSAPDEQSLDNMKLPELKILLKSLGGKPGSLRKQELINECRRCMSSATDKASSNNPNLGSAAAFSKSMLPTDKIALKYAKSATVGLELSTANSDSSAAGTTAKAAPQLGGNQSKKKIRNMPAFNPDNALGSSDLGGSDAVPLNQRQWKHQKSDIIANIYQQQTQPYQQQQTQQQQPPQSDKRRGGKKRYPTRYPTGLLRNDRVGNAAVTGDLELTFLGTASCTPTITRGVSCLAMRHNSDIWLFDCGESSQIQLQKSRIRPSKVRKIFITHAHGDHSFGLPGVLCLIGSSFSQLEDFSDSEVRNNRNNSNNSNRGSNQGEPIDIYGPEGTRDYIRAVLQLTYSKIAAPYRVHELKEVPFLHEKYVRYPPARPVVKTRPDYSFGEVEGGTDIYPDSNGHYQILDDGDFVVQAAPMQHTIPCVGYVVTEADRVGALRVDAVKEAVEANKEQLATIPVLAQRGYRFVYSLLKDLKPGESFMFPDGQSVKQEDIIEGTKRGRKIVVMGDTCSGTHMMPLAMNADVLIHEATNAYFQDFDAARYGNYHRLERDTYHHGHSTPEMAGRFAADINAKRLILTHFSARYLGDNSDTSMHVMWRIEDMARKAAVAKVKMTAINGSPTIETAVNNGKKWLKQGAATEAAAAGSQESSNMMATASALPCSPLIDEDSVDGVIAAWDLMSICVARPASAIPATTTKSDCTSSTVTKEIDFAAGSTNAL